MLLWDSSFIKTEIVFRNFVLRQLLATLGFPTLYFDLFTIEIEGKNVTKTWQAVNSLRLERHLVASVTLSTSLFTFHLISSSPHFTDHVSFYFLQSTVHLIHFIYHSLSNSHLSYLVTLVLQRHSMLLSVSPFSQLRLWQLTTYDCLR